MISLYDVRQSQSVLDIKSHTGSKTAKLVFNNTKDWIISTGFGMGSNRELLIWDIKNPSKPLVQLVMDQGSGVMTPFFDEATQLLFITGKGESNIRYYELTQDSTHCHYISTSAEGKPQRGVTALPKRYVDHSRCEIMRFYRLTDKDTIEPISMIVPRRAAGSFQPDIFPPVVDTLHPSMTAAEWKQGANTPRKYYVFNAENAERYCTAEEAGEAASVYIPSVQSSPAPMRTIQPAPSPLATHTETAQTQRLENENKELKEQVAALQKELEEAKAKIQEQESIIAQLEKQED